MLERDPNVGTWLAVDSSNLKHVRWDEWGTLSVEFHGGAVYEYLAVPRQVFDDLLAAESKGQFFKEYVKDAGFPYRRVN